MVGALMVACKPTPRTAVEAHTPTEQEISQPTEEDQPKTESVTPHETAAVGLLDVRITRQDYNRLRPWEKKNSTTAHAMGVYLGDGKVLTVGRSARSATYVELSLPDQSRTVPARVVRYDEGLDLALLSVEHEQDATIFDNMPTLSVGDPLVRDESAELWAMARGLALVHVGVVVESANDDEEVPMLDVRSDKPLPLGMAVGLPIMKDGRLVALVENFDARQQALTCINAEFIHRFLEPTVASANGIPVLGMEFTQLDDPVFSKYLKLAQEQGGLYVSKVQPAGAAHAAGIRPGDVLISIDGMPLDKRGRCKHPIYGLLEASYVIRSLHPMGESITLGISRDGQEQEISVPLNRDAVEKGLLPHENMAVPPRYIMWGGLLFQPLTATYLDALEENAGTLPLPFMRMKTQTEELVAAGVKEPVALTFVIPTPATLSYDSLGFCLVERVNGKEVHTFAEFAELLDAPTEDGIVELALNRPPYKIYLDRQVVEATNDIIRRRSIHRLRQMNDAEEHARSAGEASRPADPQQ